MDPKNSILHDFDWAVGSWWGRALGPLLMAAVVMWSGMCEVRGATSPLLEAGHFTREIHPILKEYCVSCHSDSKHKGDLSLEPYISPAEARKHPKVIQGIVEQVVNGEMPPKDKAQPTGEQREALLQWANALLDDLALARAGDPGPVVLRRLSNAEYTYTIRDLTGVATLDPAREFPVDSASGEGFMNVGNSLVMSPTLVTKYLDAAKDLAQHAVLLPDGIRFSASTTRRDWTEELLAEIRALYDLYSDHGGGTAVNLQGIQFDTNTGGRLPVERYVHVLLLEREGKAIPAQDMKGLSASYLKTLRDLLNSREPSLLLDPIRRKFRDSTSVGGDAAELASRIKNWQQALWKFNSVGHIGKKDGPMAWMEPVSPLVTRQEVRLKLPGMSHGTGTGSEVTTFYLSATDAGDGHSGDTVLWKNAQFKAPGRPTLGLKDLPRVSDRLFELREKVARTAAAGLKAAAQVEKSGDTRVSLENLRLEHGLEPVILDSWLHLLGMDHESGVQIEGLLTQKLSQVSGYAFVTGWGSPETPNMAANSSDQAVRIPGNLKPHGVVVHPSPKLAAVIGWKNPLTRTLTVRVQTRIQHAHPECGNGTTWSLEHRRGSTRSRLASGVAAGGKPVTPPAIESLLIKPGDVLSLVVGSRDGNHSCDLTAVDLVIKPLGDNASPEWDLAQDVSGDFTASNPHADRQGHSNVWHFYVEPDRNDSLPPPIPAGSLLARWQSETGASERDRLAMEIQALLTGPGLGETNSPDAQLRRQILSFSGAFFGHVIRKELAGLPKMGVEEATRSRWGTQQGRWSGGQGDSHLVVGAPQVLEVRMPAELAAGSEFSAVVELDPVSGTEGSVQVEASLTRPARLGELQPSTVTASGTAGTWTDPAPKVSIAQPILIGTGPQTRSRIESQFAVFRSVFPAALCYTKIVPVDEVVTLTLFYREDQAYQRLMLNDGERQRLDRLWDELHYVSQDALTLVDAYEQLWQFATQDADPKVFEPMRKPIYERAAAFKKRLSETQPAHVEAVVQWAGKAYRRPLEESDGAELRKLYSQLRGQDLDHDSAIRTLLSRVLVSPAFLYRTENAGPGSGSNPVTSWEMANRLSYFLWSSAPDERLRERAGRDELRQREAIMGEMHRMLKDPRAARLSREFGAAWLHLYDFAELGEKSERHFPTFAGLREDMLQETLHFFTDLFQNDGSVLSILDSDHTYLNEALARHYGIDGIQGADFRRVEKVRQHGRGGVLTHAASLSKQSGASRTSPILRGNWISEVILGEKLPKPPKDVPRLPEDEATEKLSVRELVERHSSDPRCSSCHKRIDPYGFAMEEFDAIGRRRTRDLGDRAIDTHVRVMDGRELAGMQGLKEYLTIQRQDAFLRQFCRKLLGYALGRSVMLSDEPLVKEMRAALKANHFKISAALDVLVQSRQFREIRGKEHPVED